MMRIKNAALWATAVLGMLALGGCNGTATETAELRNQVKQLTTTLDKTKAEKNQLEKDVETFKESLGEAESGLADAKRTNEKLRTEVNQLIAARDQLETKVGTLTTTGVKLQNQVNQLSKARTELQAKVQELGTARSQLQVRVDELTKSRDDLQTMVENLVDTRGVLEKQVAALTKSRDAALADAKTAQTKINQLNDKLQVQTEQMLGLQDQIKAIRAVLQQLQQKLE